MGTFLSKKNRKNLCLQGKTRDLLRQEEKMKTFDTDNGKRRKRKTRDKERVREKKKSIEKGDDK